MDQKGFLRMGIERASAVAVFWLGTLSTLRRLLVPVEVDEHVTHGRYPGKCTFIRMYVMSD